jgi:serine/threonine protein kinase
MCKNGKKCRAWISLKSVGIQAEGCLRCDKWIDSLVIPCSQPILNQDVYINLPNESLVFKNNVFHGKYGHIDLATYTVSGKQKEVYVKRPIIPGKSLIYEACIQKLVGENLKNIGFPTGAPQVLSIFKLRDNSICFAMEEIDGAITLDKYLDIIPIYKMANIIVDCLLQLCAMVWHLDYTLGINHRDLKPSNFLIIEHESPVRKVLVIENNILEIQSHYSLTYIDFGFSCLGSTETYSSDISLSTVYSKMDPCPKEGRDMYLFLAFLYIEYHTKLPLKLLALFESWLEINGSNLCKFMRKDKKNAEEWIYWMTGNEKIKSFKTCPHKILSDLQNLT